MSATRLPTLDDRRRRNRCHMSRPIPGQTASAAAQNERPLHFKDQRTWQGGLHQKQIGSSYASVVSIVGSNVPREHDNRGRPVDSSSELTDKRRAFDDRVREGQLGDDDI